MTVLSGECGRVNIVLSKGKRILDTFNQYLPMILPDNYYGQRKPTTCKNALKFCISKPKSP